MVPKDRIGQFCRDIIFVALHLLVHFNLILYLHFTKSLKHDSIYKLYCMLRFAKTQKVL